MKHSSRITVRSSDDKAEDKGTAITFGVKRFPWVGHRALPKMAIETERDQRLSRRSWLDGHAYQNPLVRGASNIACRSFLAADTPAIVMLEPRAAIFQARFLTRSKLWKVCAGTMLPTSDIAN